MVRVQDEGAALEFDWLCVCSGYLDANVTLQLLVVAIPAPSGSRSWLPAGVQLPADGESRRLEYRDAEDVGEDDSLADEVRRLNSDSQLATTVEGTRERNGVLLPRENQWSLASEAA